MPNEMEQYNSNDHITNIRTIETKNFAVRINALVGYMSPDETFDPTVFNMDKIYADLRSGKTVWFCAQVQVIHKQLGFVLAEDYLGGCYYNDYDEFTNDHSGYVYDMVLGCVDVARDTLSDMRSILCE